MLLPTFMVDICLKLLLTCWLLSSKDYYNTCIIQVHYSVGGMWKSSKLCISVLVKTNCVGNPKYDEVANIVLLKEA